MKIQPLSIAGAALVELSPIRDDRGFFARVWCVREFAEHGLATQWVQGNVAVTNRRGTLRGLHYQVAPALEAKLVQCWRGALFDVVVDLRPDSPTFRQWEGIELRGGDGRSVYIPEGCAHGYQTLEDDTALYYQASTFYAPKHATGARFDDPAFRIAWPLPVTVMSEQDRRWPLVGG